MSISFIILCLFLLCTFSCTAEIEEANFRIDAPRYVVDKKNLKPGTVLKAVSLSKPFKQLIVATHNRLRSISEPPASNMRRMTWDMELEKIAKSYTRKCIYEHNPNPKHRRFQHVGENLFISIGLPFNKLLLKRAIEAWDGEKEVYDYETRKCNPGKICGHYTQVVWAETFKVGCGVTMCGNIDVRGKIWRNSVLFACNYGPGGNYPTHPFISGPRCSKCHLKDRCKRGICYNSIRDKFKVNIAGAKWTTWSPWSSCSEGCGIGSQKRKRSCNTFVPLDCNGFPSEVKFCFIKPCRNQNNGGSFTYNIVVGENDKLLKNSLEQALKEKLGGSFKGYIRTD